MLSTSLVAILTMVPLRGGAQPISANGVKALNSTGAITPTGTWSFATRAGVYVAGTCDSPVKR